MTPLRTVLASVLAFLSEFLLEEVSAVIERGETTGLNPGLVVVVLGPANAVVTQALWAAGLRPVRGQRHGSVWAFPGATVPR